MIRRELIEGSQSKEAEQVEPGQANSPHEDILRQPLAFSGASSQDISGHAGPRAALLEWNEKDNRQIDQQASTSGSGLKQGEPDQVTGKRKRATEYFAALINLPEARDAVFQKFDLPDIIMAYQSFDEGYKILGSLDDKKRQKVIDNLKGSELAEHFALLKTSDERKQFLG